MLNNQHKCTIGNFSTSNFSFCLSNFIEPAAEMNCASMLASFSFPWNRRVQRIVNFEDSRRVPETTESPAIPCGQPFPGDAQKIPRRDVEQNGARFRQISKTLYAMPSSDFASEFTEISGQRIRDCL